MIRRQHNSTLPAPTRPMNRGKGFKRKPIGGVFASTEGKRKPLRHRSAKSVIPTTVRAEVSRRSGGICEICRKARATNKHHKLPRSQGGKHTAENLLDLCGPCHDEVHAHPAAAYAKGHLVKADKRFAFAPIEPKTQPGQRLVTGTEQMREGDAPRQQPPQTPVVSKGTAGAFKESA